jgi:hypothetical protein
MSKIRVSGMVGGSIRKKRIMSGRYHDNQGEERNPMGYVPNKGVGGTTILSLFFKFMQSYTPT